MIIFADTESCHTQSEIMSETLICMTWYRFIITLRYIIAKNCMIHTKQIIDTWWNAGLKIKSSAWSNFMRSIFLWNTGFCLGTSAPVINGLNVINKGNSQHVLLTSYLGTKWSNQIKELKNLEIFIIILANNELHL